MSHSALTVLHFVRQQGWLIPEDFETFSQLRELGITAFRLHERHVPLLKIAIGKRKIRGKIKNFSLLENDFHERLGTAWTARFGKATLERNSIVLNCKASAAARNAIDKVETGVRNFCARWGLSVTTEFSEAGSRYRYVAKYKYSPDLNPVLPYPTDGADSVICFDLGFTRIEITFDAQRLVPAFSRGGFNARPDIGPAGTPDHRLRVLVKSADNWIPVHTGSFVDSTVGDIKTLMRLTSELANRAKQHDD
jgi:hypothetical protein